MWRSVPVGGRLAALKLDRHRPRGRLEGEVDARVRRSRSTCRCRSAPCRRSSCGSTGSRGCSGASARTRAGSGRRRGTASCCASDRPGRTDRPRPATKLARLSFSYSGSPGCGRPSMKSRNSSCASSSQSPKSLLIRMLLADHALIERHGELGPPAARLREPGEIDLTAARQQHGLGAVVGGCFRRHVRLRHWRSSAARRCWRGRSCRTRRRRRLRRRG